MRAAAFLKPVSLLYETHQTQGLGDYLISLVQAGGWDKTERCGVGGLVDFRIVRVSHIL